MGYRIRVDEPGDHPRVVDVTGPVEVGRQVDGIRLFDPTVSRRHVMLEVQREGLIVTDLGSSYGSFAHGYRLAGPVLIRPGEVIQVGNSRLTVLGPVADPEAGAAVPGVAPGVDVAATAVPAPPGVAAISPHPGYPLDAVEDPATVAAPAAVPPTASAAQVLTPPPPTDRALTPPPPGMPAPPMPPAGSPTPVAPPAPPPAMHPDPDPPVAAAAAAPVPVPGPVPGPPANQGGFGTGVFARRPGLVLVALNVATLLALALPVELVFTIRDAITDLRPDDLTARMVLLGASLLVSVVGLLGLTTLRALADGARNEDADVLVTDVGRDRRLVAVGMLPTWWVVMSIVALTTDLAVGALTAVAMAAVVGIWLWAAAAASAAPPAPAPGPIDAAAMPRPPVREVAVAALALICILVVVVTGITLGQTLDRSILQGTAVVQLFVVLQAPLPLLGLLRP